MSWLARTNYLAAKTEKKRVEYYAMDLLWLLAKTHYQDLPQPSKIATGEPEKDRRSGQQIREDLIRKLTK